MHVTVLDGDSRAPGTPLDRAIAELVVAFGARGDGCERLRLSQMRLGQCVGCFDCWVKTPGRCRLRDDGPALHRALARSDLVVFASPMRVGFTSALLKRATDRCIPILLPFIDVVGGECHHALRYGHPVDLALLVERGDATEAELDATERIYRRLAKNLHGSLAWLRFAGVTNDASKEAAHALDVA